MELTRHAALTSLRYHDRQVLASLAVMEMKELFYCLVQEAERRRLNLGRCAVVIDMAHSRRRGAFPGHQSVMINLDVALRDLYRNSAWSNLPTLAIQHRNNMVERLATGCSDQLLIEVRHDDGRVREDGRCALLYVPMRVDWETLTKNTDANRFRAVSKNVHEKVHRILLEDRQSFISYWKGGQMERDTLRAARQYQSF